jgi:hypothetical protein
VQDIGAGHAPAGRGIREGILKVFILSWSILYHRGRTVRRKGTGGDSEERIDLPQGKKPTCFRNRLIFNTLILILVVPSMLVVIYATIFHVPEGFVPGVVRPLLVLLLIVVFSLYLHAFSTDFVRTNFWWRKVRGMLYRTVRSTIADVASGLDESLPASSHDLTKKEIQPPFEPRPSIEYRDDQSRIILRPDPTDRERTMVFYSPNVSILTDDLYG